MEQLFRKRKKPVGRRGDGELAKSISGEKIIGNTYIKLKIRMEIQLTFCRPRKDKECQQRAFLFKAIKNNEVPEIINIDKSVANIGAIRVYNKRSFSNVLIKQCKYLNNIAEQKNSE